MKLPLTLFACALATAAPAATITQTGPGHGIAVALDLADFTASGPCGSGHSVINDGCSPVIKTAASPKRDGRFNPVDLGAPWVDSSDLMRLTWDLDFGQKAVSFTFAVVDAFDQPERPWAGLGVSFFNVRADGGRRWWVARREAESNVHWLTVLFAAPQQRVSIAFGTRHNDGFGISNPTIAPVPLPATAWLLLAGLAGFFGIHRGRRAARASQR